MKKLLNQFNNFGYLTTSFNLKMQDLFGTSNHREYLKCGTKFSYPSYCFYFTYMLKILYNTLFFKVSYIFVKIVQHKQNTRKRREKTTFFKIQKKNKIQTNVTQRSELQKLYTTYKEKIKTRLKLI